MSALPLHSHLNIKRIAICLYGQYRTGDICLDYIKDFYNMDDYIIDFFCSLKPYETTYTRHIYNKAMGKPAFSIEKLDENITLNQVETIKNKLNPKKIKIYSYEYEQELKDIDTTLVFSKVLAAWADVIFLKNLYEVENNITYDMVVMQRYDTIVYPMHAFKSIVRSFNGINVSTRETFRTADKNILLTNSIAYWRPYPGMLGYQNGQDLFCIGFGTALDTLAYESLNHIPSKFSSLFDIKKYYNGYPVIDTHEMVGTIAAKMNIPRFEYPVIDDNGIAYTAYQIRPLPGANEVRFRGIAPIPIRESYGETSPLYFKSNDALEKYYESVFTKWANGE